MKKDHELAGIELLRFVCAFAILVWHYQHFFFRGVWTAQAGATLRSTLPLYPWLSLLYNHGSLAVPFFWAISGFIFYWHYADDIAGKRVKFWDFSVRRFSRLYPLHIVTLILVAMGQYFYYETHREPFIYSGNRLLWFATQLAFASNWFSWQPLSFNGPIWSVSIEILIYLVFFMIARALGPRAFIAACGVAAFAVCFNFLHGPIDHDVFACGLYFFAGGVAQRLAVRTAALPWAGCAAILAVGALMHYGRNTPCLILLAMSSVIIMTKLGETDLRVPCRHLAFLGNATYSSYLLHFPLQLLLVLIIDALGWPRDLFYSPLAFIGFLAGVVGLSLVVHRYFEMPAQAFIRSLARHSK